MARYKKDPYKRYRREYKANPGAERARQHIEEARRLTLELGGTDRDVKNYFFSLRGKELNEVLNDYQKQFGKAPREYAEETLGQWRSGERQMSGLVAGRLFSLLPNRMPTHRKFDLVESLWRHCGPRSSKTLWVGKDVQASQLVKEVKKYFSDKVMHYYLDPNITNRFTWLGGSDSVLVQDLQNHFIKLEKEAIESASYDRLSSLADHSGRNDGISTSLAQTFVVGKHEIKIIFDSRVEGISEEGPQSSGAGCLLPIIIGGGLLIAMNPMAGTVAFAVIMGIGFFKYILD